MRGAGVGIGSGSSEAPLVPTGVSSDATGQGEPARGEAIPTRALDDGLSEAVREELARREQSQPLQGQAIPHSRVHESV